MPGLGVQPARKLGPDSGVKRVVIDDRARESSFGELVCASPGQNVDVKRDQAGVVTHQTFFVQVD